MQPIDNKLLSVHDDQWRELLGAGLSRLPHALLLSGASGLGKQQFAEHLVRLLLCEQPDLVGSLPKSCGICSGCRWVASNTHPDVRYLSPDGDDGEEGDATINSPTDTGAEAGPPATSKTRTKKRGSASIKVAAIRELEEFVFIGSHRQGPRIVVITNADAMNVIATNALLKILEEPPATVYFILITSKQDRLLQTLRSRCRVLGFVRPSAQAASQYLTARGMPADSQSLLSLAGGAPMQVLRWRESGQVDGLKTLLQTFRQPGNNPLALAGRWDDLLKKDDHLKMDFLVEAVQRWVVDAALGSAGEGNHAMFAAWRALLQCRRSARHPLNQLLFLEEIATHALRATSSPLIPQHSHA